MPERNNHHYDILKDSKLFEGVEMEDIPDVLSCLQAQERCYKKGETILHFGDSIRLAGIVLSGKAKVSFYDETITPITIKFLMPGDTFGQVAACETDFKSPIELTAVFDSRILLLDLYPILHGDKTSCHFYSKVSANLIRDLAEHSAFLNMRLRIIGQKRLRDKLKVYLSALPVSQGGCMQLPFSMTDLAAFLSADRSALYREIRCLKKEGILEWDNRTIRILKPEFEI